MKRNFNNRVRKLERQLSIDKKRLTLSRAFELFEREEQGEKIDWERYDTTEIDKLVRDMK